MAALCCCCPLQEASLQPTAVMQRLKRMLSHRSLAGLSLSKREAALGLLPQTIAAGAAARRGDRT